MGVKVQSIQQQVIHLISRIQSNEIRRSRESREVNRQKLTVPVTVRFLSNQSEVEAISRDLSSLGIGLISSQPIATNEVCELELEVDSASSRLLATCQHCESFGKGYYISGWRFENVCS